MLKRKLLEFIKEVQSDRRLISLDEAATKQGVILKILSFLGWDPFNIEEIYPEFPVGAGRVDFALRHNNYNKVFIEVKKVGEDLEKHQEQILNYSFQYGVKIAILTNGITWWFYLPLHEGSWEQRRFYTIEIYEQNAEDIAQKFIDFLSKENVISGKAVENAEKIYKSKQRSILIKETLPMAWNKIIKEPDDSLVELIAETTEKLCGYRPDHTTVEEFLISHVQTEMPKLPKPRKTEWVKEKDLPQSYTGASIAAFKFKGERYEVKSWRAMLLKVCEIMLSSHRENFDKVLNLAGRKRPYFTKNPNELRSPERISGTDIFVETNLSANSIVRLSKSILQLFGYSEKDLMIELRK